MSTFFCWSNKRSIFSVKKRENKYLYFKIQNFVKLANRWKRYQEQKTHIIQLLFWPEKFDGFRILLQFFKNSNAICFFKQNLLCESLKIPNKYYELPPLQLLRIESYWKSRRYRNSQNITVKNNQSNSKMVSRISNKIVGILNISPNQI